MEGEEREENGEAWVSCESVSKISVYLHKGCVCVCVCECECGVCVKSFLYLRIGFVCEEISL